MISIKNIKELGFETIEDVFNYAIESKLNGQPTQASDLISKMSIKQKRDFLNYIDFNADIENEMREWLKKETFMRLYGPRRYK